MGHCSAIVIRVVHSGGNSTVQNHLFEAAPSVVAAVVISTQLTKYTNTKCKAR